MHIHLKYKIPHVAKIIRLSHEYFENIAVCMLGSYVYAFVNMRYDIYYQAGSKASSLSCGFVSDL